MQHDFFDISWALTGVFRYTPVLIYLLAPICVKNTLFYQSNFAKTCSIGRATYDLVVFPFLVISIFNLFCFSFSMGIPNVCGMASSYECSFVRDFGHFLFLLIRGISQSR